MTEIFDEHGNPIEAHNEDGDPIDVFDENEVKEKLTEKEEEAKINFEEKLEEKTAEYDERVAKKDEEIEQIKKDIEAGEGGDKAKNLTGLRKKLEDAEKSKDEITAKFDSYKEETDKKIQGIHETVSNKRIDDAIKAKVGEDKELGDKVRVHFNRLKPTESTDPVKREEDFQERIGHAHILATGGVQPNTVSEVAGTTGGYVPGIKGEATHETPEGELKDMGTQKMGLSEKDFRDHRKAKGNG